MLHGASIWSTRFGCGQFGGQRPQATIDLSLIDDGTYVIARPQAVTLGLGMVVHSEQKTEIYGGGIGATLTAPHPFMVLLSFKAMTGAPWVVYVTAAGAIDKCGRFKSS